MWLVVGDSLWRQWLADHDRTVEDCLWKYSQRSRQHYLCVQLLDYTSSLIAAVRRSRRNSGGGGDWLG